MTNDLQDKMFVGVCKHTEINEIIDDTFMGKCVSELIKEDFYLFDVRNVKDNTTNEDISYMFYYKDGIVCVAKIVKDQIFVHECLEYNKGSLESFKCNYIL